MLNHPAAVGHGRHRASRHSGPYLVAPAVGALAAAAVVLLCSPSSVTQTARSAPLSVATPTPWWLDPSGYAAIGW